MVSKNIKYRKNTSRLKINKDHNSSSSNSKNKHFKDQKKVKTLRITLESKYEFCINSNSIFDMSNESSKSDSHYEEFDYYDRIIVDKS